MKKLKTWIAALSLANLCFWRDWANVFPNTLQGDPEVLYLSLDRPFPTGPAMILWVGALTLLLRALGTRLAPLLPPKIATVLFSLLLVLAPFSLFTFGQSLGLRPPPTLSTATTAPERPLHRTIVLVFDEWDEGLATDGSAPDPLAALKKESLWASQAYAPHGCTLLSIPSLLTGTPFADARATGPSELIVRQTEGAERPLASFPSLFSQASALGARIGVVGYFHPYCRLFGPSLSRCRSFSSQELDYGPLPLLPLTFLSPWIERETHAHRNNFLQITELARNWANDPDLDLLYVHLPFPRLPGLWNSQTEQLRWDGPYGEAAYRENLTLAGRWLGEFRSSLSSGSPGSRLLLTADHGFRDSPHSNESSEAGKKYQRVPLVVHVPGGDSHLIDRPISTLPLSQWVISLLTEDSPNFRQALSLAPPPAAPSTLPSNEYCKIPR